MQFVEMSRRDSTRVPFGFLGFHELIAQLLKRRIALTLRSFHTTFVILAFPKIVSQSFVGFGPNPVVAENAFDTLAPLAVWVCRSGG
jgi:hypothetical protein